MILLSILAKFSTHPVFFHSNENWVNVFWPDRNKKNLEFEMGQNLKLIEPNFAFMVLENDIFFNFLVYSGSGKYYCPAAPAIIKGFKTM